MGGVEGDGDHRRKKTKERGRKPKPCQTLNNKKDNKDWRCAPIRNVARQGITSMCYHLCLFVCLCKPPIIGVLEKETESCSKEGPITSSVVDSLCSSSPLKYTSIFLACFSNFFLPSSRSFWYYCLVNVKPKVPLHDENKI